MKFSILRILSSVACVLVFQGALGEGKGITSSENQNRQAVVSTYSMIQEFRNVRDNQEQQNILDTFSTFGLVALRNGDRDTALNTMEIITFLCNHWQQQYLILSQWNDIQQRIQELSQLPEGERNEFELLQLNLIGLQLAEKHADLIDISDSAPEFHRFLLLQVTSRLETLSMLRDWLRWAQRQHNNWDISLNLSITNRNILQTNQFLKENPTNEEEKQCYWSEILNIRLQQDVLEDELIKLNESLESKYPQLTISAYEQILRERKESETNTEAQSNLCGS